MPRYIDAHAHLHFAAYDADRDACIARAKEAGVAVINVGTQLDTSRGAVELAEKHDDFYAVVGLHPTHTSASHFDKNELGEAGKEFVMNGEVFDASAYEALGRHGKVVAIGECGLDYFRLPEESKARQQEVFISHIELANRLRKPLMCHIRSSTSLGVDSAYKDAHALLRAHAQVRGDIHFFAGTVDEARLFLDLGFMLSFTGVVTFAAAYAEVVKFVPSDRILSETDCPYVTPVPYRGKRNEPAYIPYIVEALARMKDVSTEDMAFQITKNAQTLFGIAP